MRILVIGGPQNGTPNFEKPPYVDYVEIYVLFLGSTSSLSRNHRYIVETRADAVRLGGRDPREITSVKAARSSRVLGLGFRA